MAFVDLVGEAIYGAGAESLATVTGFSTSTESGIHIVAGEGVHGSVPVHLAEKQGGDFPAPPWGKMAVQATCEV